MKTKTVCILEPLLIMVTKLACTQMFYFSFQ